MATVRRRGTLCNSEPPGMATRLVDGSRYILAFAFSFDERNAGRNDKQSIVCHLPGQRSRLGSFAIFVAMPPRLVTRQ